MSHDLEQLLRDTLQGRAATVTDAPTVPAPDGRSDGSRRSHWLLVAATVALILVVGAGVAVWGLGHGGSAEKSGGGYARSCRAALPPAWRTALTAAPTAVQGRPTTVLELTRYGDVVDWLDANGAEHLGLRSSSGQLRSLDDVLRGRRLSGTGVDGRTLLLSIAPAVTRAVPDPLVDDLEAVDLSDLEARDVLAAPGVPLDTVVADKAAAIVGGTVYWVAVPRGTQDPSTAGRVLALHLATGRVEVAGQATNLLSGPDEPRGVLWDGGTVRRPGVPASVPALRDNGYDPVVSNGPDFAWLRSDADVHLIGWADTAGAERRWEVSTIGRDVRADPIAVSGPFVLLGPQGVGDGHLFVLDTRTGAVADSGLQSFGATAHGTRVAVVTRANDRTPSRTTVLDTAHLPGLHC